MTAYIGTKEMVLSENEIEGFVNFHIRPISQEFYKKEILKDLLLEGKSLVDPHAGMGWYWNIKSKNAEDSSQKNTVADCQERLAL